MVNQFTFLDLKGKLLEIKKSPEAYGLRSEKWRHYRRHYKRAYYGKRASSLLWHIDYSKELGIFVIPDCEQWGLCLGAEAAWSTVMVYHRGIYEMLEYRERFGESTVCPRPLSEMIGPMSFFEDREKGPTILEEIMGLERI